MKNKNDSIEVQLDEVGSLLNKQDIEVAAALRFGLQSNQVNLIDQEEGLREFLYREINMSHFGDDQIRYDEPEFDAEFDALFNQLAELAYRNGKLQRFRIAA